MSRLVIAQIYVDPEDWSKLEDKVGKRNRSAFIRKCIADEVAEPEEEEEIEIEKSKLMKTWTRLDEKQRKKREERETTIRQLEEEGQSINNAEELIDSILEQNQGIKRIKDYTNSENGEIIEIQETHIAEDELRSIAKKFNQKYSELKLYVESKENAKIWKTHKLVLDSNESDPTKRQQFKAEKS